MKSFNSIEVLEEALLALSKELEETRKQSKQRMEALEKIFPYEFYKEIRPDVARSVGSNKAELLGHFLRRGNNEIDIEAAMNKNIEQMHSFQRELKSKCLRDTTLFTLAGEATNNRQLLKTANTSVNINSNSYHSFALRHTLIHLKSNTIATWIPKVACSNIRYSFAFANGVISKEEDIDWIHRNNTEFNASNKELLSASHTFVVLRNPFKRLLSFFTDKICHAEESIKDPSYSHAQNVFGKIKSFEDFVDTISNSPSLIELDEHTRHQCDFLVYEKYDNYYSLENYQSITEGLEKTSGIKLQDVRKFNSIHTTSDCSESSDLGPKTDLSTIRNYLSQGKKAIAKNMYTNDMIKKVATLYLPDILLYCNSLEEGEREMRYWIHRSI